jgi:hypothetical protein
MKLYHFTCNSYEASHIVYFLAFPLQENEQILQEIKAFNFDLNLHEQTATEISKYRRQSIVVHRKTQVSKGKVTGNKLWKTCQRVRNVPSCAISL